MARSVQLIIEGVCCLHATIHTCSEAKAKHCLFSLFSQNRFVGASAGVQAGEGMARSGKAGGGGGAHVDYVQSPLDDHQQDFQGGAKPITFVLSGLLVFHEQYHLLKSSGV